MQRSNDAFRPAGGVCGSPVGAGPAGENRPGATDLEGDGRAAGSRSAAGRPASSSHHPSAPRAGHVYAALDLGTNNCRLLVARPTRRSFHVIDAFSRIIRLGEGVSQAGVLLEPAMRRTLDALEICADKMRRRSVTRSRLIATEACRIARNGPEFIDKVRERTGLELEIVSRETEARLAVSGCASLLDRQAERALVFDIGGGSSELVWLELRPAEEPDRRGQPQQRPDVHHSIAGWTSLPVGVVTLSERFGGHDIDRPLFERMVAHVHTMLAPFEEAHGIARQLRRHRAHLLGTSGTVTTVAGIHLGLRSYDRNRVDGSWLGAEDVRRVADRLLELTYHGRVAEPCIGPDRADLVLAGCAILEAIMRTWPCDQLRVADRGLREGILSTLMAEDGIFRARRRRPDGASPP